jgi:AraC-like DNA-binding protein
MKRAGSAGAAHADRRRYELVIENYLNDCYRRRTAARVTELAELLDAARPYLSRVIRQLFGKTPRTVMRERQLSEAKRLLAVTSLDVQEIAAASAFGDSTTFFRFFKRAEGMTPGEYRSRLRRKK